MSNRLSNCVTKVSDTQFKYHNLNQVHSTTFYINSKVIYLMTCDS